MVSKWEMQQYLQKNTEKLPFIYNKEEDAVYNKDGEYLCTLDKFLENYRKKSGESFEYIYGEHVALFSVLRCTECGTVIFTYEDEGYDPNLKCPTCTGYQTGFDYWTQAEIDADEQKQKELQSMKEIMEDRKIRDERIKRRGGKYDWEIGKKTLNFKNHRITLELECDDITQSYLKGLRLDVHIWKKEDKEDSCFSLSKHLIIPLGLTSLYRQIVFNYNYKKEKKMEVM